MGLVDLIDQQNPLNPSNVEALRLLKMCASKLDKVIREVVLLAAENARIGLTH
jgi:hypothetical protein